MNSNHSQLFLSITCFRKSTEHVLIESKTGADFWSRKSESFLHDTRSESRFRFSTPKIGAGFRPRVSSALDWNLAVAPTPQGTGEGNAAVHQFALTEEGED